jgi:hypothetical protein
MSVAQADEHPTSPESTIAAEEKLEDSPFDEKQQDVLPHSSMLSAGQMVASPSKQEHPSDQLEHQFDDSLSATSNEYVSEGDSEDFMPITTAATFDSSGDDETARGVLSDLLMAHQTALEEDSESSAFFGDEEEDDFAAMLNYESSESEGEDDTVTTIRQDKEDSLLGPLTSQRLSFGDSVASSAASSIATVRQRRLSSIGMAPSTSMLPQRQQSIASISESTQLSSDMVTKSTTTVLPFRDEAPVKPTEQHHRAPPGTLCLSPMQRTPMQARKWRQLAVAAQEKDSKQQSNRGRQRLSERSVNVLW